MFDHQIKELFLRYGLENHFPVDPFLIASKEKIIVFHSDCEFSDRFGMIRKSKHQGIIFYLASNWDLTHQRFFLAHLLAHFFLHLSDQEHVHMHCHITYATDLGTTNRKECEADEFARCLMIPEHFLNKCLTNKKSIAYISQQLDVPQNQVHARIKQLKSEHSRNSSNHLLPKDNVG
ncbi:ImmA/IrrE family metallo-endopeptidase [Sporolactobacillus shoreicorticis]|uniref:ImmA/IrrE family metallo-endopeptidase n=1 Tax=Sporolactobacillus shoreicorticis TaxID=1923877 RepID=A0ABW5S2R4_9BACL|nr:ImmA/IrrE family metallo-endopeptidase [Sporolactobacillus shoreicorticis]MCO7128288.1 ImmA/IrrE family metallo-endopeptidase [Sporolactobacillus shoreicorticis]